MLWISTHLCIAFKSYGPFIKVFRFRRKAFYWLYGLLLLLLLFFSTFLSGRFLRDGWTDFLEIFRKDALHLYLGKFFEFVKNSLPVGKYGRFSLFKKSFCPAVFSKTVKDRVMKFSGMIDLSIAVCDWGLSISTITSGRHRKWKMKSENLKLQLWNCNLYHFIKSLLKN